MNFDWNKFFESLFNAGTSILGGLNNQGGGGNIPLGTNNPYTPAMPPQAAVSPMLIYGFLGIALLMLLKK